MQVQNVYPTFQQLGSFYRPSIANQQQEYQEDKADHEGDEEEINDDNVASDEDTENEEKVEEENNDDCVDDGDEEDVEEKQQHHHLQPEFISPAQIFIDIDTPPSANSHLPKIEPTIQYLLKEGDHSIHGMPTQAGSSPSLVGAHPNTMQCFDASNINRVYQPGFVQYEQSRQSSYHFNNGTRRSEPSLDSPNENSENLQPGGKYAYFNCFV